MATDHSVCDCLYIALAERETASLASADSRMMDLARMQGVAIETF